MLVAAWELFSETGDLSDFIDTLLRIVKVGAINDDDGEGGDDDDDASADASAASGGAPTAATRATKSAMASTEEDVAFLGILTECAKWLLSKGMLTQAQALALLELAKTGNSVVKAAFQVRPSSISFDRAF